MFTRRFSSWFAVSTLCLVALPQIRGATPSEACADGSGFGVWKLPMTSSGHGVMIGRLLDPEDRRDSLRIRADLADEPITCATCVQGSIHGYLDNGDGGPPRYEVVGTYVGSTDGGPGRFDLHVLPMNGLAAIGEIHGQFDIPRSPGFRARFRAGWRIC